MSMNTELAKELMALRGSLTDYEAARKRYRVMAAKHQKLSMQERAERNGAEEWCQKQGMTKTDAGKRYMECPAYTRFTEKLDAAQVERDQADDELAVARRRHDTSLAIVHALSGVSEAQGEARRSGR